MKFRYPVLSLSIFLFIVSTALLISGEIKWRFFDAPERGGFTGNIAMLPGSSRSDTKEMLDEMIRAVNSVYMEYEK